MSTAIYKSYSPEDKKALTELREFAAMKLKMPPADVKIADMIMAVTPELETPVHLRGC